MLSLVCLKLEGKAEGLMGELDELSGDEFVVVVVFRQHGSAYLFCQFHSVLHVMLRVGTGINLIVIFKALELEAIPVFVELHHLAPQHDHVFLLLFLLDLWIYVIIFATFLWFQADLDVTRSLWYLIESIESVASLKTI